MKKKANRRLNGNGVCRGICRHCNVVVGLLADSIGKSFREECTTAILIWQPKYD